MVLGSENVAVPFMELGGDPTSFDPDWRTKVACAIADGFDEKKLPKQLREDVILKHAKFIKSFKSAGNVEAIYAKYPVNGLVMNWASGANGSQTRHYLQALLLTDQPISVVAADLQLDEAAVKLYCDLYFSCRSAKDDYAMLLPVETRLAFAFGEIAHDTRQTQSYVMWRVMAVKEGYSALVRHWGLEKSAHGALDDESVAMNRNMHLANTIMSQQLRSGTIGFRSAVEFQNSWMTYKKMTEDMNSNDDANSPLFEMVVGMFSVLSPKLVVAVPTEEEKKAEIKAVNKKRLAEKNVESHNQSEFETGLVKVKSEFNKMKRERFKSMDGTGSRKR